MSSSSFPRDPAPTPDHPLARAFASFTEAASSLERTYGQLQAQVAHLRQELEVTNRDLAKSLEENGRIREWLRRILEGLPCGVLVMEAGAQISILNPEAERLLGGHKCDANSLSPLLSAALEQARETGEERDLLLPSADGVNTTWVAVRHAWLEQEQAHSTSVFILSDVSAAKKLELEREQVGRQQALVEMSALLAHEIPNPLGSLELFAGLLAEANLEGDSQRWIEHVQAGLRTLAATVNNVLHLYNTPQPEQAEMDLGQLLDWAHDFLLPIALEYGPEMAAPIVVAKGRNLLAAEIRQIARWHGIPMVENLPLAHILYRSVEVGLSIPPKLQTSVLATHLAELIRQHAYELLTRQETKRLLDRLSESHPKLVEELVPKMLSLGDVQKVLQQLLREQVSIRDLSTILEALLDASATSKNPIQLVEVARQALGRALVRPLLSDDGGLRVLTLDHSIEEELSRAFSPQMPQTTSAGLQPSFVRRVLDRLRQLAGEQVAQTAPVLLCSTPARFHLRRLLEPFLPKVVVLSPLEIPSMVPVQSLGTVR